VAKARLTDEAVGALQSAVHRRLAAQVLLETGDAPGALDLLTNVPWSVDPAFRRPGRFDRVLFVPPPDRAARERILEILLKDRPTTGDLGLAAAAKATSGYSGADWSNLVETAVDEAIEASIESGTELPVNAKNMQAALKEVKPTVLEWLTTARNYARYANESGQYDEVLTFLSKHGKS
jgi:transitional endoplasmic reticulum ATPase